MALIAIDHCVRSRECFYCVSSSMVAGLISSLILLYSALYAITAADTVDIKKPARGGFGVWGFVIASIVPRQLKARSLERALSRHTCVFASHDTL
jgi:hypothetical protein